MTVIHSQASYGGWRRVSHRPRRASLLQKALAAVRDWRRRLHDRNRSSAFDDQGLRDSGICRSEGDPPPIWWTPMLGFRARRKVSDEHNTPGISGGLQTRSG